MPKQRLAAGLLIILIVSFSLGCSGGNKNAVNLEGNTAGNLNNLGYAAIQGDWIFYRTSDGNMYKTHVEDGGKDLIAEDCRNFINIVGQWVYYVNRSGNIYKIRTDGSEQTLIHNISVGELRVVGEWMYYTKMHERRSIFRSRLDGSDETQITTETA